MKLLLWTKRGLTATLAAGCLWLHSSPTAAQEAETNSVAVIEEGSVAEITNAAPATEVMPERAHVRKRGSVVAFFQTAELEQGQTADAVVAIGGSSKSRGDVKEAVVAIFGNADVEGSVGDAVVAVMGDVTVTGKVRGNVVAVMGNVTLGENTVVNGEVVAVGGKVIAPESASIKGKIQELPIGNIPGLGSLRGLRDWFTQCLLKFRLLSFGIVWPWWIVAGYFLLYLLITAAAPKAVGACVDEMTRRPATTLLMGLLAKLLVPLVMFLLTATGVGLVVIPFIGVALKIAVLVGKAALFVYLGKMILRGFGTSSPVSPLLALTLGSVVVTLTYVVPILSLMVFTMTGMWALGAALTAAFGGVRRELPQRPIPPTPPPPHTGAMSGIAPTFMAAHAAFPTAENPNPTNPQPQSAQSTTQPPMPEAYALQRARFWERMAAAFLDVILVSILAPIVYNPIVGLLIALAYFSGMWAWKGTTIGGIVLNLKVVRYDGQPVTFAVALVRALAAAFSTIVLFLGFFWIAWDRDKQGWHDKIAGTLVVRQPRATPLVCL